MIDVRTLKPFPSWGEPTLNELVTVRSSVNGKPTSYRVAVMADVPARETGRPKSGRVNAVNERGRST